MGYELLKSRLTGCYVTIPTMFRDSDLALDLTATRQAARFLLDNGMDEDHGTLLVGGAAGDFSTMRFSERIRVLEEVVDEVNGAMPIAIGGQSTSTQESVEIAKAAEALGAQFIQVSCPYYFQHTQSDFLEHIETIASQTNIGLIIYNTFWTSSEVSNWLIDEIAKIPNVVGLKWATGRSDSMEFEEVVAAYADRFSIIDNHLKFCISHALGARAFEVHTCNYWPEWGVRLIDQLNAGRYKEVQLNLIKTTLPFYQLWREIEENYTSGDGYLDKLCMELVGLKSSRSRPPTRDIRSEYRERARQMLIECNVPRVLSRPN
jgi:dihydrodipicolinate synthase/N-acetylneuraminate lyase